MAGPPSKKPMEVSCAGRPNAM